MPESNSSPAAATNRVEGIREPTQQRSHDVLDKLLTAGSELLAERGADGFTLREVSQRAGISYGAMYWRIENKDALLNAVHDRLNQRILTRVEAFGSSEPWADLDLDEATERAVRGVAGVFQDDPVLLRALSLYSTRDPKLTERAASTVHRGNEEFQKVLAPHLAANGHPAPELTAAALFTMVSGSMTARITWPEYHAGPELSWEQFLDDLCLMSVAFVRASTSGA